MTRTLFSLAILGAAAAIFLLYTKPAYDGIRDIQAEIGEYDQALAKADELQRLKQSLLSRYNSFDPVEIDRLHKLLPDHVDNVRLVLDLDTLAARHGFALQNVVINAPGTAVATQEAPTIGVSRRTFDSLTLRFATSGTYQNFVQFMLALENSLRIVDVTSLTIDVDSGVVQGSEPVYRYDITLRTYWLK